MSQYSVTEEWRIREIEQKAECSTSRLHELDALRSGLDSLERTMRELGAEVTELRAELQDCKDQQAEYLRMQEEKGGGG